MQSYALSGFNPSILPFFNFFSCGAYTKFATATAMLAITVANSILQFFNSPLYLIGQLHEEPAPLLRHVVADIHPRLPVLRSEEVVDVNIYP